MHRDALLRHLDETLAPTRFQDYCPNGLQVEGRDEIRTLVTGVTASLALIETAAERGADALLVHHGYFWKGEDARVIGMKQRRLRRLLESGISLFAYHLPLDAHPELGNNAQLARVLGLVAQGTLDGDERRPGLLWHGETPQQHSAAALAALIGERLGRPPLHVAPPDDRPIRRLAWCTGAAQSFIEQAAAAGMDAFISGEISEQTTHVARECGLHFLGCGHHATERYGVRALGEHLAGRFDLSHIFVDIDNPA